MGGACGLYRISMSTMGGASVYESNVALHLFLKIIKLLLENGWSFCVL